MQARLSILTLLLASTLSAFAGGPDCTGISGVFNSDPDLFGELSTVRVASGLSNPVFVAAAPGDNDRLFIVEKSGRIKILKNGIVQGTLFLDITSVVSTAGSNERGMLGLAFHPDYQNNDHFFVYYTAVSPSGSLTVARYTRTTADVADPASGQIVIQISHPISNHNGGTIAFSPLDGHLYVGTGDGGSACDPGASPGNAQNLSSLLGKMLRLNVDSLPYSTAGNPFDGGIPGLNEIWSYGLRNPFRWSFDLVTGGQYIGDVGQDSREEVSCTANSSGGENYGWNAYEANLCDSCNEWAPACPITLTNYKPPVRDYSLSGTPCSVIGGHVYRGCRMADLRGTYFYSDHCDDFVRTFRTDGLCSNPAPPDVNRENDLEPPDSGVSIISIAAYGQDNRGELYIVEHGTSGEVFKIIPELFIMELSGQGATPFTMNAAGDFVWENLPLSSSVPVRFYRIYRADTSTPGSGPGPFVCIHKQGFLSTAWSGGDPDTPSSGQVFYYLALAENAAGDLTVPGVQSNGTLRVVDAAACPI